MKNNEMKKIFEKEYRKVLNHRETCSKWNRCPKELCLECFGGGLTKFTESIIEQFEQKEQELKKEIEINKTQMFIEKKLEQELLTKLKEQRKKIEDRIEQHNIEIIVKELNSLVEGGNRYDKCNLC